jgi:hypothetical protein
MKGHKATVWPTAGAVEMKGHKATVRLTGGAVAIR